MRENVNRPHASRFKTLVSYLKRPMFYGTLLTIVRAKLLRLLGLATNTRQQAIEWCARMGTDTASALQILGGALDTEDLKSLYSEEFAFAERMAASCPTPMGGAANLPLIFWLCESVSARNAIETGVAYGWSSMTILLSLRKRGGRLVSTDMPYPGLDNDRFVGCVVPESLRDRWKIIRSPDHQALPKALREMPTLDFCHYDSDKSYQGRMRAYKVLWKALRQGGIFVSDDIGDNLAFRDFSESVQARPIVVTYEDKFCGVLVKS